MPIAAQLTLLGILAAAGFVYYWRLATHLPAPLRPKVDFGKIDIALASVLALMIMAQTVQSFSVKTFHVTHEAIMQMIFLNFCVVATIMGVLIGRDRNPLTLFGLRWPNWRTGIFFAIGSLLAAYPLIFLPVGITNLMGVPSEAQPVVEYLATAKGLSERLPMIFMAVVAAPVAEEVIFRGYLHGVLRKWSGRWFSIVATSLLFSAMHGHIPALVPLFIFAMTLALVYEKTGSLWASLIMHSLFNSVTVVIALQWPGLLK